MKIEYVHTERSRDAPCACAKCMERRMGKRPKVLILNGVPPKYVCRPLKYIVTRGLLRAGTKFFLRRLAVYLHHLSGRLIILTMQKPYELAHRLPPHIWTPWVEKEEP